MTWTPRPPRPVGPTPTPPVPQPVQPSPPAYRTERIDESTPFRQVGDLAPDRFAAVLRAADSPITGGAMADCHAAARGYTLLALAQAAKESQYGKTSPRGSHNPLGLMDRDGRTLLRFGQWSDAFAEYRRRMSDPAYKSGVYLPMDMPMRQYIAIYVGGPGCWSSGMTLCANGETRDSVLLYLRQTVDRVNGWIAAAPSPPAPTPDPDPAPGGIVFGRVPVPANYQLRILPPTLNMAYTRMQRIPRGMVWHRMLGTLDGTDSYFRGAARASARTDFGLGRTGGGQAAVYQWTPLWSDIAPWASGASSPAAAKPSGDGVAFVSKYGHRYNSDLASIEVAGWYDDPLDAEVRARLVETSAWVADNWLKCPYTTWPVVPSTGLTAVYWHAEFTSEKPCPGNWIRNETDRLIAEVGERLERFQKAR